MRTDEDLLMRMAMEFSETSKGAEAEDIADFITILICAYMSHFFPDRDLEDQLEGIDALTKDAKEWHRESHEMRMGKEPH